MAHLPSTFRLISHRGWKTLEMGWWAGVIWGMLPPPPPPPPIFTEGALGSVPILPYVPGSH